MMGKNAVTLMELLVVIVIIAILAAIAVPIYTNRIESTRGERAIVNIELIASAIKGYCIKNNITTAPNFSGIDTISEINSTLSLELVDSNFNYTLDFMLPAYNIYWQIKATRNSGTYLNYILVYESISPPSSVAGERWSPRSTWPWTPHN